MWQHSHINQSINQGILRWTKHNQSTNQSISINSLSSPPSPVHFLLRPPHRQKSTWQIILVPRHPFPQRRSAGAPTVLKRWWCDPWHSRTGGCASPHSAPWTWHGDPWRRACSWPAQSARISARPPCSCSRKRAPPPLWWPSSQKYHWKNFERKLKNFFLIFEKNLKNFEKFLKILKNLIS